MLFVGLVAIVLGGLLIYAGYRNVSVGALLQGKIRPK